MEEVMDGQKDSERVSGHKSCHNQPALQHSLKSMNKTGLINELIVQDGWQPGWTAVAPGREYDGWTDVWVDGQYENCEGAVCENFL